MPMHFFLFAILHAVTVYSQGRRQFLMSRTQYGNGAFIPFFSRWCRKASIDDRHLQWSPNISRFLLLHCIVIKLPLEIPPVSTLWRDQTDFMPTVRI